MKKEIKIGMALDNYKLADSEKWWKKCLAERPEIEKEYDFVKEEVSEGLTPGTTMLYRYYKLKTMVTVN